jgi:iron complex transport system substrate-binding protein
MLRAALLCLCLVQAAFAQPARIVSTSPSITEILFGLGAGPSVVGVSTYCRYPEQVRQLPKVGTYSKPNAERIALLKPDLVILHRQNGDLANRMEALGIRTLTIEQGSLAQLFATMRAIGDAVGRRTQAEALVARIQGKIQPAAARKNTAGPSVLLIVSKDREQLASLIAAGPRTYLGELLEAAGGRNALTSASAQNYPRISLETVIHLNPDFIIDASGMGDEPNDTPEQRKRTIAPWLVRGELKAVRHHRVSAVLSEALVVPGPRVVEALDLLRNVISGWREDR